MIHHTVNDKSDHWAVGVSSNHKDLLIQLQEDGNQARILLPIEHAQVMVELLQYYIDKINAAQKANGI